MNNNENIYNNDSQEPVSNAKKNISLLLIIGILFLTVIGGTFAYFAGSAINSIVTGNMGSIKLDLTVTKVLPNSNGADDILVINYNELAGALNSRCVDEDGDFALCQLYKVTLVNDASGVSTNIKGSLSFNNTNTPNLSWVLLGNSYSSSTTYTSSMLGNTFNTASSNFTSFVDGYLLSAGSTINYYILVWINETTEEQNDMGTFSGTVRFEDTNGKGVTASFGS